MLSIKNVLQESLRKLQDISIESLLERRFNRLMGHGKYKEVKPERHT